MEYLMLGIAMVLFYQRLGEHWARRRDALSAVDFAELLAHFPDTIVPERRKKRPYISSILSKNEVQREDPYNRKLFLRLKRGHYLINPTLALRIEGDWRPIYRVLQPLRLAPQLRGPIRWGDHEWDPSTEAANAMMALRSLLKDLEEGRKLEELF